MIVTSGQELIAVGDADFGVQIWDLEGREAFSTYEGHGNRDLMAVVEMPDGRIVTGGESGFQIWTVGAKSPAVEKEHKQAVSAVAALPDGRLLTGQTEGMVRAWTLSDGIEMDFDYRPHFQSGEGSVDHIAVVDGDKVASAGDNGLFFGRVPPPSPGQEGTALPGSSLLADSVNGIGLGVDGTLIIAGPSGSPNTVSVIAPAIPSDMAEYSGHRSSVKSAVLLPSGLIASGDEDGAIHRWAPGEEAGSELLNLEVGVTALAVTATGNLAAALADGQVMIIHLNGSIGNTTTNQPAGLALSDLSFKATDSGGGVWGVAELSTPSGKQACFFHDLRAIGPERGEFDLGREFTTLTLELVIDEGTENTLGESQTSPTDAVVTVRFKDATSPERALAEAEVRFGFASTLEFNVAGLARLQLELDRVEQGTVDDNINIAVGLCGGQLT